MTNELEKIVREIKSKDEKIGKAVDLITQYGGEDGGHHKQWLLDQTMRALLGNDYQTWRNAYDNHTNENGERYSEWDEGIAP